MDVHMTLQRRIAVLKAERDWTQIDLARELGMSPNAFGERYRGTRDFRVQEIVRLAGVFDVPIHSLFEGLERTTEYRTANIRGKQLREAYGYYDDED